MQWRLNRKLASSLIPIITICWTLFAAAAPAHAKSLSEIKVKPIPPGYNFPTPAATIDKWIKTSDTAAIQQHAWDIWAGITANSGEHYRGKELPIWETWYGFEDIFPQVLSSHMTNITQATAAEFLATHRQALHTFIEPHQFMHLKSGLTKFQLFGPTPNRLLSFNKFSPDAATFIVAPQSGPGGKTYYYNSKESLNNLSNAWPSDTPIQDRKINEFPIKSLELKPVFTIVSATGLTLIPVWEGVGASIAPETPTYNTWTTCVIVDPNGKGDKARPATAKEIAQVKTVGFACKRFLYGPLSLLYSFRVTQAEATAFNNVRRNHAVKANDFAALLALHISSRETPFWTWQTFYWQPTGVVDPKEFPGSKRGQTKKVKAPWTNYAACTNYAQTTKPNGRTMNVCFSPYIEPGLPSGIASNCMSCHGAATISKNESPFPEEYKEPIPFFTDPTYFNSDSMRTGFSWAVASATIDNN